MEDPYELLGVSRQASMEEIRRCYKKLALLHHPDHWMGKGCSPEEIASHKEMFQRITLAYHTLLKKETADVPSWDSVWQKIEAVFQRHSVFETLSSFLKKTFEMKSRHSFCIPVSLEDIAQKRRKKVRLLLKGFEDGTRTGTGTDATRTGTESIPIFITVMCEKYPIYETTVIQKGIFRHLTLRLIPTEHPYYTVDEYEENPDVRIDDTSGFNLYRGLSMTLMDYFTGKTVEWTHPSGETMCFTVPPFTGVGSASYVFWKKEIGKGLLGKGDLIICLEWVFPTVPEWEHLDSQEKENWFKLLRKMRLDAFREN